MQPCTPEGRILAIPRIPCRSRTDIPRGRDAPVTIGIMADSHGRWAMISAALEVFREAGCRHVIHLGDICDSNRTETADTCVGLLEAGGVAAVKGNNDHQLARAGGAQAAISRHTRAYLDRLPLVVRLAGAVFAHSRPFADELGLSCLVGTMGEPELDRFFSQFPATILFRGHSHDPGIVSQADRSRAEKPLPQGRPLELFPGTGYVITCGALTRGYCLLWEPDAGRLACISLPRKG